MSMLGIKWKLHGTGKSIKPGHVVAPDERLAWPLTIGVGMQHVVAMFGATFLVPILTGMPPATTLFFSGIGTLLFAFGIGPLGHYFLLQLHLGVGGGDPDPDATIGE